MRSPTEYAHHLTLPLKKDGRAFRVLLVVRNESSRLSLQRRLARLRAAIDTVNDVATAQRIVERSPFDAVLGDHLLDVGPLFDWLARNAPETRRVLIGRTASDVTSADAVIERSCAAGELAAAMYDTRS